MEEWRGEVTVKQHFGERHRYWWTWPCDARQSHFSARSILQGRKATVSTQLQAVLPTMFLTGPPGPPEDVTIDEITDTTAQLSWRPGADNHSPITMYVVQARTPFSVGWQAVSTGKGCANPPSCAAGEGALWELLSHGSALSVVSLAVGRCSS